MTRILSKLIAVVVTIAALFSVVAVQEAHAFPINIFSSGVTLCSTLYPDGKKPYKICLGDVGVWEPGEYPEYRARGK